MIFKLIVFALVGLVVYKFITGRFPSLTTGNGKSSMGMRRERR